MNADFDVVVVGAGLAGLQTARLLAERDLSVLLVDARSDVRLGIRTTGIFVRKTLEDFDLPASLLGPVVSQVSLYSPKGTRIDLASRHDEFRLGRMGEIYAHYLRRCFDAGVEWWPSTAYVSSVACHGGSQVELRSGNREELIRVRWIVGADGCASRVGRDLALDLNRDCLIGIEEVADAPRRRVSPRFHCFVDPQIAPGYIGWVVDDGIEVHVGVGGIPGRFDPTRSLSEMRRRAASLLGVDSLPVAERRAGRIPIGGVLRRIGSDRGLLVGDAAGAVSPLTAGGLDAAMRMPILAADVTARWLASREGPILREYAGQRFRSRFWSRLWLRRIFSAIHDPSLIDLAFSGASLPLVHWLARHVFYARGSFPDVEIRHVSIDRGFARASIIP